MTGCLQWATAAVAALAVGAPVAPTPCVGEGAVALTVGAISGIQGEAGRAAAALRAAERGDAWAARANYLAGVWSLRVRDPVSAEANFRAALDFNPSLARARVGLVVARTRRGRRAGALKAARGFSGGIGALRGPADLELRRVEEVLGPALELTLDGPNNGCSGCWSKLGEAYAAAAQRRVPALASSWWDRAAEAFRRAVAEDPGNPQLRMALGRALSQRSRHPAALAVYRAGLAQVPGWTHGRLLIAAALLDMHRPSEAIAELEAVAPALGDRAGWSLLGTAYRSVGRSKDALAAYGRALRRGPEQVGDLLGLHHASWQAGEGGRIDLVERAAEREPGHAGAWFALAQARQASGDRAGARRAHDRYAKLSEAVQARLDREEAGVRVSMTASEALAEIAGGRRAAASRILQGSDGLDGLLPLARVALGEPTSADLEATVRRCVDANP